MSILDLLLTIPKIECVFVAAVLAGKAKTTLLKEFRGFYNF